MVVEEYKLKNGTASIHDDAYAGVSVEEMGRRIREAQRVAWGIACRAARRKEQCNDREGRNHSAPAAER